ncbi:hypothetical protein [Halococcus sp. IIIV-5B]|uniref:hypothetical protein n=1 Tax=Halococcus sp. IIIV-5B TaxID=2321230 RepID=UPI000E750053|nr:hypothetical protein [Halococcus sp. IIIV-5B]RJT06808.1 hypothetical protein D3261_04670 [Halococcus sp. IIIV-5B]
MLAVDLEISVTACGHEPTEDGRWNDVLLERCGRDVRAVSTHVLDGGVVDADTDPDELYHAFVGFAAQLGGPLWTSTTGWSLLVSRPRNST